MTETRLKLLPAATQLRVSRETLRKRLVEVDAKPDKDGAYTLYDIVRALVGDAKAVRVRGMQLDNDLKDIEIAEKREQLMGTAAAMAIFNAWGLPIRQKLVAAESELKHRCNPVDPELAGKALKDWVNSAMRLIQSEINRVAVEVNNENPIPA